MSDTLLALEAIVGAAAASSQLRASSRVAENDSTFQGSRFLAGANFRLGTYDRVVNGLLRQLAFGCEAARMSVQPHSSRRRRLCAGAGSVTGAASHHQLPRRRSKSALATLKGPSRSRAENAWSRSLPGRHATALLRRFGRRREASLPALISAAGDRDDGHDSRLAGHAPNPAKQSGTQVSYGANAMDAVATGAEASVEAMLCRPVSALRRTRGHRLPEVIASAAPNALTSVSRLRGASDGPGEGVSSRKLLWPGSRARRPLFGSVLMKRERERKPQLVVETCISLFLFFVVLGLFALAYLFGRLLAL